MRRQLSVQVWPGSCRRIEVRLAFCGLFPATLFDAGRAGAVRPFVTDDARIVNKGQLETESFAGMTFSSGGRPGYHLGALQGFSPTDWMEIIAGGAGLEYHESRLSVDDLVLQPKFLLHRPFGIIPSLSVAGGWLFPISGDRQRWNSCAMAHASWFLFTPEASEDPYDNGLAVHVNAGNRWTGWTRKERNCHCRSSPSCQWIPSKALVVFRNQLRLTQRPRPISILMRPTLRAVGILVPRKLLETRSRWSCWISSSLTWSVVM